MKLKKIILLILLLLAIGGVYFFFNVLPPCNVGHYYSLSGCTRCSENSISKGGHNIFCTPCNSPDKANNNNTMCVTPQMLASVAAGCSPGSYFDPKLFSCKKCPDNTISQGRQNISCTPCISPQVANFNNTICMNPEK